MTPTLLNNRYRIIRTLGSGGFGETFLAEDTQMPSGRYCVIKQLKPVANNPQIYQLVQERFAREAAILEDLGEANSQIPSLYAYFSESGQFYLVQEWVEGETLTKKLQTSGLWSESSVKALLISILPVLDYVHNKRIVHRDIKPENIMLRQRDGLPVLIDFGAVKETMGTVASSSGNSTSSIVIGTPGFMPSEQAAGRPIFSSDLYSLGLTAIYLLTGKWPQELETDPRSGEIVWRQHAPMLSPTLAGVLEKAIQYHPLHRYATAREMLDALQAQAAPMASTVPFHQPTVEPTVPIAPRSERHSSMPVDRGDSHKAIVTGSLIVGGLIGASIIVGLALNKSAPPPSETSAGQQPLSPSASASPAAPSASASGEIISRPSPEQTVQTQYSLINSRNYSTAWSNLSRAFQSNTSIFPDGYTSFLNWWQTVDWVETREVQLVNRTNQTATVDVRLNYSMKNGDVSSESRRLRLVWESEKDRWLIDETQQQ